MKSAWRPLPCSSRQRPPSHAGGRSRCSYRPHLEALEDRLAPATHNSLATALPLSLNSAQQVQAADILTDPTEYYRVTAGHNGLLTAAVTVADPTVWLPRLALEDNSGQLLIQSDAAASKNPSAQLDQIVQPGTYYLAVSAVTGAVNLSGNRSFVLVCSFTPALPPFSPLPVGNGPSSVATADFNHDGNLDLVTANSLDNSVSVLLGLGDGAFQPAETYSVQDASGKGKGPVATAVAQINGQWDIVTANSGDNTVSVLVGNGDGTFQPARTYSVVDAFGQGLDPLAVTVGDFNGNSDIVTADYADGRVSVLAGNGDGTFQQPAVTYGVGTEPRSVAVGSFSGSPGIVTADYGSNAVSVLLPSGNGFAPAVSYPVGRHPYALTLGDFNGHADIVTANSGDAPGTVSVLLGSGDGIFTPGATLPVGNFPESVVVGDFNNDGNLDIAAANTNDKTISLWLGQGDGVHFQPGTTLAVASSPSLAVGDFSNDGNLDLATANYFNNTVSLLLGRGDGSFVAGLPSVGRSPVSAAVGDFNNDGNVDIATANYRDSTVSVLLGRGDGTFQPAVTYPVGLFPLFVAAGDLNNDGNLDLVTANSGDSTLSVLLGRGDGTFLPGDPLTLPPGSSPNCVALGDFSHNGNLDIAVTCFLTDKVWVFMGRGDGTFSPPVPYNVGISPESVAVGDFNHDGNLDLVIANVGDSTVSVLLGNGNGTFRPAVSYHVGSVTVASHPYAVTVGTFNGNLDIVTADYGDNTVSVLLGDGHGGFPQLLTYPVGSFPESVAVGDFNHDGNLDIAAANYDDSTVSVLLGLGNGTFQAGATLPVGENPASVAVGDFNNDGNLDLVTANYGDNSVSLLLGAGTSQFQTATPQNGIARRNVPYLQDLSGDGLPDALILDSSGELLFRRGLAGQTDEFAPPVIINPGRPTRDATVFRMPGGWGVAAVDDAGNTVSIYTWEQALNHGQGAFLRSSGFATGNLPVRIAAADLNGNGSDDLVVANDFDNSVSIAIQTSPGKFSDILTRPVGAGPSDIALLNQPGQKGPDIVVSGQVSGDFTVLLNDGTATSMPTFSQEYRYRAGSGLFGMNGTSGAQTIASELQTVTIAAGAFTGPGTNELIALNRGAEGFVLFASQGQGGFSGPQASYFPTSGQPSQVVPLTLPGDSLQSVAILTNQIQSDGQDLGQIWIFRWSPARGGSTSAGAFDLTAVVNAGNDPSGFSVTTVHGQLALVVGNAYGDVLTLLYDGHGNFAPDRANLNRVTLATGNLAGSGQQFVVVADQQLGAVWLYYFVPGTNQLGMRLSVSGTMPLPLFAPGAAQVFYLHDEPYLAVANSLSNDVLVYHYDPKARQFTFLKSYPVGDNPVSVTVADVNGDGVPDLLVANQGSNDVSVLIGGSDPSSGLWTATAYQRLNSGGSGPFAVAVTNTKSSHGPDLLVTNSDGQVTLLPGIGSNGTGSGFFQDTNPQTVNRGGPIVQSLLNATTGQFFVLGADGSVSTLDGDTFRTIVSQDVAALGEFNADLLAGFDDGTIGLLSGAGTLLKSVPTGFTDEPSALEILENNEVVATERGNDVPIVVSFNFNSISLVPVVTDLPAPGAVAEGTSLPGVPPLVLVATLLSGGLVERVSARATITVPGEETFVLFVPPRAAEEILELAALDDTAADTTEALTEHVPEAPPHWQDFVLGATDALRVQTQRQQFQDRVEELMGVFQEFIIHFRGLRTSTPTPPAPAATEGRQPAAPQPSEVVENQPFQEAPAPTVDKLDPRDFLDTVVAGYVALYVCTWPLREREQYRLGRVDVNQQAVR